MPETVQHCPLCGSPHSRPFDQRAFHGQPVSNRICTSCSLVYQSPRMDAQETAVFYEQAYRQLYQGSEGPNPKDLAVQRGRASSLLAFGRAWLAPVKRFLDIGCSAGILLERYRQAYNCQVVGVEPGNAYRSFAQAKGLNVYASLDELQPAGEAPFDLICMAHVIEHIPNPVEYLANLRQLHLSQGGRLLLEAPNLYAHDCFELAHMTSFSPHTLTMLLEQAGFKVEKIETHGLPRSEVIPLYITALARPDAGLPERKPHPERYVSFKRLLGTLRRDLIARLSPQRAWLPLKEWKE